MESTESSINFQLYWLVLKRRWLPASVTFSLVFILTALNAFRQQPVYLAEAKLAFKKTSPTSSITGLGKEVSEFTSIGEQSNPLSTEQEVIRSMPIIQKTLNKLQLKDAEGFPLRPEQFLKQFQVSPIRGTDIIAISYNDKNPEISATVVNTVVDIYLANNQSVNRSEAVAAREFIERQLPNAETSVRQAEAALRRFKEKNKVIELQEESKSAVSVIADLDRQMAQVSSELANAKAQVQSFQNELGMNAEQALAATTLSQSPSIQEALKQYQEVERLLAIERTRFQDNHPIIVNLNRKEATLKQLIQEQIKQTLGDQKQLPNGNLQIGEVKPKLIEEFVKTEAKRQGLAEQMAAWQTLKTAYQKRVNVLPSLEQEQRQLENKLQAAQSTYSTLLQKLQEIRITENQNSGNARIVQSAVVPDKPMPSRRALLLVTGVLLGTLSAIAIAMILESKDKFIKTIEEIKLSFTFNLLGVIPDEKKVGKITKGSSLMPSFTTRSWEESIPQVIVRDIPESPISAAYRLLQAHLMLFSSNQAPRTIVVTSSVPKEGKSTVSANLAMTLAQLGRRVLLVDGNLGHPLQHQIWQLSNQVGFSDLILDHKDLQIGIKEVMVNLEVLTAGAIAPHAIALSDSQQMAFLLEKFSANYDCIIIDTPALNVASDALILGKMVDGVLLVVRPGVVDTASANLSQELLQKSAQNVIGLVVNGISSKTETKSYYYFTNKSCETKTDMPEARYNLDV